jgi:hypothetical protein
MRLLAALAALAVSLALSAGPARADNSRTEARRQVSCSQGTRASLRLRVDKGAIRIELQLEHRRRPGSWRVVVLHERRIAVRATLTGTGVSVRLELRRSVPNWYGTDAIVARATGPRGEICLLGATL